MDRREFLKKAFQMGGVAALYNLGVTLEQAQAWGVMPASIMDPAVAPDNWPTWDEASEDTLDVDQDGDGAEDTFICFMENTSNGGDETGRGGGLSGADLVLTQAGNIAGATGSPPTRSLDSTDDEFDITQNLMELIKDQGNWIILFKCTNVGGAVGNDSYIHWYVDGNNRIQISDNGSNKIRFYYSRGGVIALDSTTTDAIPGASDYWLAFWYDGTYIRGGFSASKPTKWSDFDAGKRVSAACSTNWSAAMTGNVGKLFDDSNTSGRHIDTDAYYYLMSQAQLIDNAA